MAFVNRRWLAPRRLPQLTLQQSAAAVTSSLQRLARQQLRPLQQLNSRAQQSRCAAGGTLAFCVSNFVAWRPQRPSASGPCCVVHFMLPAARFSTPNAVLPSAAALRGQIRCCTTVPCPRTSPLQQKSHNQARSTYRRHLRPVPVRVVVGAVPVGVQLLEPRGLIDDLVQVVEEVLPHLRGKPTNRGRERRSERQPLSDTLQVWWRTGSGEVDAAGRLHRDDAKAGAPAACSRSAGKGMQRQSSVSRFRGVGEEGTQASCDCAQGQRVSVRLCLLATRRTWVQSQQKEVASPFPSAMLLLACSNAHLKKRRHSNASAVWQRCERDIG